MKLSRNRKTSYRLIYQFLAEVEFGVLSNDCTNYGICHVTEFRKKNREEERTSDATGIISILNSNKIEIDFLRTTIKDNAYSRFFASGGFLMQEDFLFYKEDKETLYFKIEKGIYRIIENTNFIKVQFY